MPDQQTYNFDGIAAAAPQQKPRALPSELDRPDRHLIGFTNKDGSPADPFGTLEQHIADWSSRLPESLRAPVATYFASHVEALRALFDSVNTPEGAATTLAPHVPNVAGPVVEGAAAAAQPVFDAAMTKSGRALDAAGRLVETLGSKLDKPSRYIGAFEFLRDPVKGTATIFAPRIVQSAGRVMQKGGQALAGDAASGLSAADASALARQGYSPEVVSAIRDQLRSGAGRGTTPAPAGSALPSPAAPVPSPAAAAQTPPALMPTKVKLSAAEFDAANQLVKAGYDPKAVLRELVKARGENPAIVDVQPNEANVYQQLVAKGKSHEQALNAIEAMRHLSKGLPTDAEVAASVTDRNASGRWPEEQ